MNPFDYGPALAKSFAALWSGDTEGFAKAQSEAADAFANGMKALSATPDQDLTQATKALQDLWHAATTLSTSLATRLPAESGSTVDNVYRRMMDPGTWLTTGTGDMHEALGRMAEGPRFADLWDMERRYARVMQAWATLRRASLEHNAVSLEAWMRAGRLFSDELAAAKDARPDHKATIARWTAIANRELVANQRSDAFLATQAAMIRATTDLRMAQQDLVEQAGKQYGFPTRTELDDVHRTVTELRREIRALKRDARRPATPPATQPIPPPAPKPRQKAPAAVPRRKP